MKFFFFLLFCLSTVGLAGEIKAIILCDTIAENIEASVASDMKNIQEALKKISKKTGLKLAVKVIASDYLKEPFLAHINSLQINKDDIVFFYFSGHGFRTERKKDNQWPDLYLTPDHQALDFKEITQILQEKKPRLLIAFADCCNNILDEESAPPTQSLHAFKSHKPIKPELTNYKRLFINTKGSIIISGAAPGEFSWGTLKGGLFTLAFLQSIVDEVHYPRPANWRVLIERAVLKIVRKEIGQNPQFILNISE